MKGIPNHQKEPATTGSIVSFGRRMALATALICGLAGLVQTTTAQTVEYDFATGKFAKVISNDARVGIDGGATINTKEGSTINVRVVNLNKEAYKATITAKEIPSPSQTDLAALLQLLGVEKGNYPGFQKPDKKLATVLNTEAYKVAFESLYNYVTIAKRKAVRASEEYAVDGSRGAVRAYLAKLSVAIAPQSLDAKGVEIVKYTINELTEEVERELERLHVSDNTPPAERTAREEELRKYKTDQRELIDEQIDLAKLLVTVLNKVVDPATFTVQLPLTMGASDIQYTLTIEALPNKPGATNMLPATTFKFRAPHEPGNLSYGFVLDYLKDDRFLLRAGNPANGEDSTKKYIAREVGDNFTPTVSALYHSPISRDVAVSFGANLKLDAGARGLFGLSYFIGAERRAVLTLGLAYGKVERLNVFDPNAPFVGDTVPTKAVTRGMLFFGLTVRK